MLAAAPITWGVCELPDWGDVPAPERVLSEMSAAGFAGTELGPDAFFGADGETVRASLARFGLQLAGAFFPLPLHDEDGGAGSLEPGEQLAAMLASAGCRTLVAADAGDDHRRDIAGRAGLNDLLPERSWRRAAQTLVALADRCAQFDVSVVFHPHAGTYVETEAEIDALMHVTPVDSVGLCLDTGHIVYGGGDPVAVARRYGERVKHVHVKDVSAGVLADVRQTGVDYATAIGRGAFTPLGEGMVDFPAFVRAMRAINYDGWWVLEQDVRLGPPWPRQDPLQNASRSRDYLLSLLLER